MGMEKGPVRTIQAVTRAYLHWKRGSSYFKVPSLLSAAHPHTLICSSSIHDWQLFTDALEVTTTQVIVCSVAVAMRIILPFVMARISGNHPLFLLLLSMIISHFYSNACEGQYLDWHPTSHFANILVSVYAEVLTGVIYFLV